MPQIRTAQQDLHSLAWLFAFEGYRVCQLPV